MAPSFKLPAALAALVASLACVPALAQSTWNYAGFTQAGSGFGNSWSASQSGTTLTVTGFGSSGSGGAFATGSVANFGGGSGFGVYNQNEGLGATSPQHAMDNNGTLDMLALHFTGAASAEVSVVLTSVTSGWSWSSGDSDISLLRWGGTGTPVITGKTQADLLTAGWTLVQGFGANMPSDTAVATGLSASSLGSSWWLISAYSSGWGHTGTGLDGGNDYVKLLASVSTLPAPKAPGTPEPASLALVAAAALGMYSMRRRSVRQR